MKQYLSFNLIFMGVVLLLTAVSFSSTKQEKTAGTMPTDTIYVAPPTGEEETDRKSIMTAFDEVEPGGTVQFAPGTYLVGELISVATPRIILAGHHDGTILRGCNSEEYEKSEKVIDLASTTNAEKVMEARSRCGMLELKGGHTTVRNLTFEQSRLGLLLGCCHLEPRFANTEGGYTIEGNIFRNSMNGIRPWTTSPSVIRGNRFINTFHAISGAGGYLQILDNEILAPEPGKVPGIEHPSFAIAMSTIPEVAAKSIGFNNSGGNIVIAENRITGHPDGIFIAALPGSRFHNNIIRNNIIQVERIQFPNNGIRPYIVDITDESNSTIVGIPLILYSREFSENPDEDVKKGSFVGNQIEGNRLIGADGLGMAIQNGSQNRIVDNIITGIQYRDPFPGNTLISSSEQWQKANGSGIWISAESVGNEIISNAFEDIHSAEIWLEGDSNRVILRGANDMVRDFGMDNRITHQY